MRERRLYAQVLATNDCASATRLLQQRFVEAHPEAPSILRNPRDYKEWKSSVLGLRFPRLYLCLALQRIQRLQGEIDRLGLKAEPFAGFEKSLSSENYETIHKAIMDRHHVVLMLHLSAASTKSTDIGLALLKLSVEGKATRFQPIYEAYLAVALRTKGIRSPIIDTILARPISQQDMEKIERIVHHRSDENLSAYAA